MQPPTESWLTSKVIIQETTNRGKGMFAVAPITQGEVIVVFGGEYVDTAQASLAEKQGKLVMQWDTDLYSVEDRGDDPAYFINHCCDGTLWMNDAFTLAARKDIAVGEEITADYALWEGDPQYRSKWTCLCGSPLCRGKVTGSDWQLPDVQGRYQGHFSPLINKMIDQK